VAMRTGPTTVLKEGELCYWTASVHTELTTAMAGRLSGCQTTKSRVCLGDGKSSGKEKREDTECSPLNASADSFMCKAGNLVRQYGVKGSAGVRKTVPTLGRRLMSLLVILNRCE